MRGKRGVAVHKGLALQPCTVKGALPRARPRGFAAFHGKKGRGCVCNLQLGNFPALVLAVPAVVDG